MSLPTTTCSYCNAIVCLPRDAVPGQRVPCPRCGESFPYLAGQAWRDSVEPASPDIGDNVPLSGGLSNRALALVVLAAMVGMALLTLFAALQTVGVRRAHDLGIAKQQEVTMPLLLKLAGNLWVIGLVLILFGIWRKSRSAAMSPPRWLWGSLAVVLAAGAFFAFVSGPIRHRSSQAGNSGGAVPLTQPLAPTQFETLAHLPSDSNVLAAIHVREMSRNFSGKSLHGFYFRVGTLEINSDHIEKSIGLKWEEIEELALALKTDGMLVPRPTLVIRSVRPFNASDLLKKLRATRIPEATRKDTYRFQWGESSFKPALWCPPEGMTLVIALTPADLEIILTSGGAGIARFASPLQTMLRERMNVPAPFWAVASSDQWDKSVLTELLAGLPQQEREMLFKVRALGIWLQFNGDVTVNAAAQCADESVSAAFRTYLAGCGKPLLHDVRTVQDGNWVAAQAHGALEGIMEILQGGRAADR